MAEFKYEITERIAVLSQSPNGWEAPAEYGELERARAQIRHPRLGARRQQNGQGHQPFPRRTGHFKGILEEMEI